MNLRQVLFVLLAVQSCVNCARKWKKYKLSSDLTKRENWFSPALDKILQEVDPNQVSFFIFNLDKSTRQQANYLIGSFSNRVPSVLLNAKMIRRDGHAWKGPSSENAWGSCPPEWEAAEWKRHPGHPGRHHGPSPTLKIGRRLTSVGLAIYFVDFQKLEESVWYESRILDIYRPPIRPKLLIVTFGNKLNSTTQKSLFQFLRHCWGCKQLHVSLLYIDKNPKIPSNVLYFNPFNNSRIMQTLNNKTKQLTIFPDKLRDMKGHPFSIFIDDDRRKMEEANKDRVDFLMNMSPSSLVFIKYYFGKVLNFSAVFGDPWDMKNKDYMLKPSNQARDTYSLSIKFLRNAIAIPHPSREDIRSEYEPLSTYYITLGFICSIVLFIWLLAKNFKVPDKNWQGFKIFTCLIGTKLLCGRDFRERLLYLILIRFSFMIMIDLTTVLTAVRVVKNEKLINNFHDLDEMNVPIYSRYPISYFEMHRPTSISLMSKTSRLKNRTALIKCLQELHEKNDRICMGDEEYVHEESARLKKKTNGRGLRLANFISNTSALATLMNKGSPYVEKFNEVVLRCTDTGILRRPTVMEYLKSKKIYMEDAIRFSIITNDEIYMIRYFYFLMGACAVATIVFLLEFVAKAIHNRKKRRVHPVGMFEMANIVKAMDYSIFITKNYAKVPEKIASSCRKK